MSTILIRGDVPEQLKEAAKNELAKKAGKLAKLAKTLKVKTADTNNIGIFLSYDYKEYYDIVDLFGALIDRIEKLRNQIT